MKGAVQISFIIILLLLLLLLQSVCVGICDDTSKSMHENTTWLTGHTCRSKQNISQPGWTCTAHRVLHFWLIDHCWGDVATAATPRWQWCGPLSAAGFKVADVNGTAAAAGKREGEAVVIVGINHFEGVTAQPMRPQQPHASSRAEEEQGRGWGGQGL